jgi:hypothetical protein
MSLVNDHTSEWRKRPINLLKVVTSFVSQLTIGDDLTRISLPTGLCVLPVALVHFQKFAIRFPCWK